MGAHWIAGEYEAAAEVIVRKLRASHGSIYAFTYAEHGVPPANCMVCDRDLKILFRLSFPNAR